jgi:hypothetical protein
MSPLMNMYDEIRANLHFNKFTVGELLFVEYKCPIEQDAAGLWTLIDYFVHGSAPKNLADHGRNLDVEKRAILCSLRKAPPPSEGKKAIGSSTWPRKTFRVAGAAS